MKQLIMTHPLMLKLSTGLVGTGLLVYFESWSLLGIAIASTSLITIAGMAFRKRYKTHNRGVILITGASSGIGKSTAEYLATTTRFDVFAGVRKDIDYQNIEKLNIPNLRPLIVDITNHNSCVNAIKHVQDFMISTKLPFVALVNNAGISRTAACEYHDLNDVRALFDTNFFGMVDMTQLVLPMLRESKGRIIMISSIFGKFGKYLL